jgi:zinc protease
MIMAAALVASFTNQAVVAQTKAIGLKKNIPGSPAGERLPLDPAIRYGKLANGFTYYIRHNEEPKNRVEMYLVNMVGSVLEDEDQRGLAHFMEHMSFNGTVHFPHNQLEDYLQKAGVRFGADLNAYTNFDETVYELPIPSDKPEILNSGIGILRDWAHEALLDPTEIDKERGVVLEEERLGKGPGERMRRLYFPLLFNHSRFAERLPIGLDKVLNNFKRPVIARFYHDWYRPDLQAIIIVGDVDVDAMERAIKSKFSDLKNPPQERPRTAYTVSLTNKNQFIAVTDREQTQVDGQIYFMRPEMELQTVADYRNLIMRSLFAQMLNGRYSERLLNADPPYLSCDAGISRFIGGLDAFYVDFKTRPGRFREGFDAAWQEIARLKAYGFTQSELDRAKRSYMNALETELAEKNKTNSSAFVEEYQDHFLNGMASPGIEKEYALSKGDIASISLDEMNRMPADLITPTNRDILVEAPESEKSNLPDEATAYKWIKDTEGETLQPYNDGVISQNVLTHEPVSGKIVDEQKNSALGFTLLTFSNGIKAVLKPTTLKNDEIVFGSYGTGGTSLYTDSDFISASNAVVITSTAGAGDFDYQAMTKYLADKQITVKPYIDELYQGVTGSATKKDLEPALRLMDAYLTEPRKDSAIFSSIIERTNALLEHRKDDPMSVFSDSVTAVWYHHIYRKSGPSLEKFKQVNLGRCFDIYNQRFANLGNQTFFFVGSFDTGQMKPLLEKYLGSLPAASVHEGFKDLHENLSAGVIKKIFYKGNEPRATVLLLFSGAYDFLRQNNMNLQALQEVLQIRLLERLREEESGVYTPQVALNVIKNPTASYLFQIQFSCAPQNADKLIASTLDEINKLKTDASTQVDIDKWKAEYSNQMETNFQNNNYWLSFLFTQFQDELELLPADSYKERMEKVNPQTLKDAANEYLSGKNYMQTVLMPENGGTASPSNHKE